jgi:hypothetical protein
MIEDAIGRSAAPPHLEPWMDLIDARDPGKKSLEHLQRMFRLQHWWRVLHHRHGNTLHGNLERLRLAMAAFLMPKDFGQEGGELIRKDLMEIGKRLGQNWLQRFNVLLHF